MSSSADVTRWFLERTERGNADTTIDALLDRGAAWTAGNEVSALVDGEAYFSRLLDELRQLSRGDSVWFSEWECDRDELLTSQGPTIGDLLAELAHDGVDVRGLVWRSRPQSMSFGEVGNLRLEAEINRRGGQVLLDQRVLPFGSHHQKYVIILRRGRPQESVAFVGGIDICHARRDSPRHEGDPQTKRMNRRYGPQAPWHDVQLAVKGPAISQLAISFRERWSDPHRRGFPTPVRAVMAHLAAEPAAPTPIGFAGEPPPEVGTQLVQILRTYPVRRPSYPFARAGEFSVARGLAKAIGQAQRLVYIEEQYLWSELSVQPLARRLSECPTLQVVLLLPRWPSADGAVTGPLARVNQISALAKLREAGGDRVGVYDLENDQGCPTYVHAKVCIIDDIWAMVGSANLNLRSLTHDSELSCAVLDRALDGTGFPRSLRRQLWAEHLGLAIDAPELSDLDHAAALWSEAGQQVASWHAEGGIGPHPPGRVMRHRPMPVAALTRLWAAPIARLLYDPDGRGREQPAGELF